MFCFETDVIIVINDICMAQISFHFSQLDNKVCGRFLKQSVTFRVRRSSMVHLVNWSIRLDG